MHVINSLLPVFALILLGKSLHAGGVLPADFFRQLNRLTYYCGLPPLLVYKIAEVDLKGGPSSGILVTLLAVIAVSIGLAYALAPLLRVPAASLGAFVQGAFRGNLAFVGFPVVFFTLGEAALAEGMLASGVCILVYNVLSVVVLLAHGQSGGLSPWAAIWKHGLSNPLILACLAGFILNLVDWELPLAARATMEVLGQMALPLALIGLGAGLSLTGLRGSLGQATVAALVNVAVCPLLGWVIGRAVGLDGIPLQTAILLLACPTAVFSYVLAEMLGNDEVMARNIVILSTLFSLGSLSIAVAVGS